MVDRICSNGFNDGTTEWIWASLRDISSLTSSAMKAIFSTPFILSGTLEQKISKEMYRNVSKTKEVKYRIGTNKKIINKEKIEKK